MEYKNYSNFKLLIKIGNDELIDLIRLEYDKCQITLTGSHLIVTTKDENSYKSEVFNLDRVKTFGGDINEKIILK